MSTSEQRQRSLEIDRQIERDRKERLRDNENPKLLLLGSSDSGKTTVIKQLKILHGGGFTDEEKAVYKSHIAHNILDATKALILGSQKLNIDCSDDSCAELEPIVLDFVLPSEGPAVIPPQIVKAIVTLWAADYMKQAWQFANIIMVQDTADYFLNNASKILEPDYELTNDDILKARFATPKVMEYKFTINDIPYRFYDVGGMIHQRKSWAPYFDSCHAILFVASLASYDQVLVEKPEINRMRDALDLFDKIINHVLLKDINVVLFLNKRDLFEAKLSRSPLVKFFPQFKGGEDYKEALRYVRAKFLSCDANKVAEDQKEADMRRKISVHATMCTDTQSVGVIIKSVIESIQKAALKSAGLA